MIVGRIFALVGILSVAAVVAWFTWPRPDTEIRVALGGVATATNGYGFSAPLGDTIHVGGSGAKRRIRVVNNDTVLHRLAMFSVTPGQRTDYTVPPGTFGGVCSAHPGSTQLTFVIQ